MINKILRVTILTLILINTLAETIKFIYNDDNCSVNMNVELYRVTALIGLFALTILQISNTNDGLLLNNNVDSIFIGHDDFSEDDPIENYESFVAV